MRTDGMSSLFWLIFGMAAVYLSYRLGLGELTRPGPGFLTFWSGIILCILAVVIFFRAHIWSGEEKTKRLGQVWTGLNWPKAVIILVLLLAYAFTFTRMGFLASTTLLLFCLFKAIDPLRWWVAIGGAALASLVSFVVFDLGFRVQLPHWLPEMLLFRLKQLLF